ncbi:MAG TPA: TonB-dependent receptor [Terriglobales bacterium]|nr:TonB-dependent receptor [Terriglobales bacterium]
MFLRKITYFLLLTSLFASAQETINNASISGRVTDPSNAPVFGASVEARQIETNFSSTSSSDGDGRFRFPYLQIGNYEIKVIQPGFAPATRKVTLSVGAAFQLPIALTVAATHEAVEVSSEVAMVETARTQIAGTIGQYEVRNLPLNGRSYLDVALLVPGVSPTNTASTQLFAETSAVPGQGISIGSQRNFSNSFILDGLSANDDAAGLSGSFYGLDSIQELQVVTSGGQAEFGRALGGYVNMVTKSGANNLHGNIYGYFRNQRLNAPNALTGTKVPMTQGQYGASLGGPILKDRTFYFANFEQRVLNQYGLITISQANVNAINAALDSFNYAGPRIANGFYPNPVHNTNFLTRIDHRFSANDQFNVRYSLYDVDSSNSRFTGGIGSVSTGAALDDLDQTIAISNIFTLSPRTVNETRAQFTNSNLKAPANDPLGPAVNISGTALFGTASGSPTARLDRLYEVVDNLSHQAGAHALRVGADYLYNDLTITYPRSIRGSYSFSSLANFQNGQYSTFTQTFGNPVIPQTNSNVGFYAQDEWHVRPGFTLNAGLRYDLQFLETIATDTNNISPRIGIAWSPFAGQKTLVRASFGLFYDRVPLRALANALLSSRNTTDFDNIQQQSTTLSFGQTGAPLFPNILSTVPSNALISFTTMNPNMQNAYSEQASLEVEQQLSARSIVSVSYQHVRGAHLIISLNQNVPSCPASGPPGTIFDPINLCRPNSNYQNNSQYSPVADSQYDGLSVSYVQRPTKWGDFRLSYAFSKAFDDVGEFFFSGPLNVFDPQQDWARSDDDQRHRMTFNANVHTSSAAARNAWQRLSHGFQLGGMLQYYSALPLNIISGVNTIQQTAGRPCLGVTAANCTISNMIGRNAGTGFDYFTLNTRLSRTFAIGERLKIEAIAEAFNALNHRNDMIPRNTYGADAFPGHARTDFGTPTAVGDPRHVQLAVRVSF